MKSLKAAHHELSQASNQFRILNEEVNGTPPFRQKVKESGLYPLRATGIEVLQINVGKMCNQTCAHCHVDAGPDRDEIMTRETMEHCLDALRASPIQVVDLTGGAPELNPHFTWFVEEIRRLKREVIVRSNLTILTSNQKYRRLPEFFARHRLTVISSLPCYTRKNTDKQRGTGVFEKSIAALRMLNQAGYGSPDTDLKLHLVYNPLGAFLPGPQAQLEADYKRILKEDYSIDFNSLYCITNMPISRFLDFLLSSGKYEAYMEKLVEAFNPVAAAAVMCRNTLSVGWEGTLYDCDFNQMLDMKVNSGSPQHIRNFSLEALNSRAIALGQHCYGCTAGCGSSCGGEIVQ